MAIDTASKRHSALTFSAVFLPGLIPDGTISQADRQAVTFAYSGLLADAPPSYSSPQRAGLQVKDRRTLNRRRYAR